MQFCRVETDFNYGMRKVENFKSFLGSIRNDAEFDMSYQRAVDKAGPPVTTVDQKINYKQLYFQVVDVIAGMLNERLQDIESFGFLVNWNSEVGEERYHQIKSTSRKSMNLYLTFQCVKAN